MRAVWRIFWVNSQGHGIYSNQPYMNQNYQREWHRLAQPRLPFLTTLNLPDLSRLMNGLVSHYPAWLAIPNKLPSDIPKFEGRAGEDPSEHVTTFHLWCSSNSLHDDSIRFDPFEAISMHPHRACSEMVYRVTKGGIRFI